MPYGSCVLFISTIGAFYSKLYNLTEHPNYNNLFEPRNPDKNKLYNHKNELEYKKNSKYKLLFDSGLSFARVIENSLKIENVDAEELKKLLKSEIIQIDDFKIKK